jgi:CDP-4-dehydro-6-deoxyglucose reductase
VRIKLSSRDRSFEAGPGQTLLDAALGAALNLPHSCKGGNCGSCRARLLEGEIHYPNGRPLGLSDAEVRDGFVLMCQAHARSDLSIETFAIATPEEAVIKRLPARIEVARPLSHDVMGVKLRLPAAERFDFQAGQYIDIMLSAGRRRSFSIASPPHDSRLLELHVRRVAGGEFSERMFHEGSQGALLSIEGPLGQFVYRAGGAERPMLMLGGGTGIAPLLSILKHVVHEKADRHVVLFWGVRAERDLYADAELRALAQDARSRPTLSYTPVLSEGTDAWQGSRGFVHEAALAALTDLGGYDIYAAGPPAMVAAVRRDCVACGADTARIFFDSFDYAPDSVRHATSAATKT